MIDRGHLCGWMGWCALPKGHLGGCQSKLGPKKPREKRKKPAPPPPPSPIIEAVPVEPSDLDLLHLAVARVGEGSSVNQKFQYLREILQKILDYETSHRS